MASGVVSTSCNKFGHGKCHKSINLLHSERCLRSVDSSYFHQLQPMECSLASFNTAIPNLTRKSKSLLMMKKKSNNLVPPVMIDGNLVEEAVLHKHLGVTISWMEHIENVATSAAKCLVN